MREKKVGQERKKIGQENRSRVEEKKVGLENRWTMDGNMSFRNKRFNKQFLSLERMIEGYTDASKASALSDRGRSAARMLEEIRGREKTGQENRCTAVKYSSREEALFEAEMRLADAGKSHLIRVLLLIVENGSNREESAAKVPRATYFRHRQQLLDFFL